MIDPNDPAVIDMIRNPTWIQDTFQAAVNPPPEPPPLPIPEGSGRTITLRVELALYAALDEWELRRIKSLQELMELIWAELTQQNQSGIRPVLTYVGMNVEKKPDAAAEGEARPTISGGPSAESGGADSAARPARDGSPRRTNAKRRAENDQG